MARPDDWTYNNQAKCYVRPDYADYPSLPRIMFKLPSNAKQLLTVKIKTEVLTKKMFWFTHMILGTKTRKRVKD